MSQLPLDMPFTKKAGRDAFIVSRCNELALAWIDRWPDWPGACRALNITGKPGRKITPCDNLARPGDKSHHP